MTGWRSRCRRSGLQAIALLSLVWLAAAGGALGTSPPADAATLESLSDRIHKASLLEALTYKPRLVFFGGSRSLRFEPSYAKQLTGLKGFNAAFINGKPEDVWAFSHTSRSVRRTCTCMRSGASRWAGSSRARRSTKA